MSDQRGKWEKNSQQWRDELDKALDKHGGNDVMTQYTNVAFAFPSSDPNPHSFDYPSIDERRLRQWAEWKGWQVQLAPEMSAVRRFGEDVYDARCGHWRGAILSVESCPSDPVRD